MIFYIENLNIFYILMKKLIKMHRAIFILFLLFSVNSFANKIPLVWQIDRDKFWEEDWLHEVLNGIELITIEDGNYEKYIDKSIVVFSSYHNTEGCTEYFEEMHRRGYTFGIINLSDERRTWSIDILSLCSFCF